MGAAPTAPEASSIPITDASAARTFSRGPVGRDVLTRLNTRNPIGGRVITPESTPADVDAQTGRERAIQAGILGALVDAGNQDGVEPAQMQQNLRDIAHFGVDAGISIDEMRSQLKMLDQDPDVYFPPDPTDNTSPSTDKTTDVDDDTPSIPDATDTTAAGATSRSSAAEDTPLQLKQERATDPETLQKIRQAEAVKIAHRILTTDLEGRIDVDKGGPAATYVALSKLGEGNKVDADHPNGLDLTDGSRIEITIKDGAGGMKKVKVDSITAIQDTDHGKVVSIKYTERNGAADISGNPAENIPMQDILDGQFAAEADAILDAFDANSPQRKVIELAVAAKGPKAAEAFHNLEEVSETLMSAAEAVGMMTRADVEAFVENLKATLPVPGKGESETPYARMKKQELSRLADSVQDVVLITPDVVTKMVEQVSVDNPATLTGNITKLDADMQRLKDHIKQIGEGIDQKTGLPLRFTAEEQLRKLHEQRVQLGQQLQVATLIQNGSLTEGLQQYQAQLESGEISIGDAREMVKGLLTGDFVGLAGQMELMKEMKEGETPDEFMNRLMHDEELKKRMKKAGFIAVILMVAMGMLATSVMPGGNMLQGGR